MLSERDRIETWPEMGISFEPLRLDIHLPSKILDPKRLEMIGLASTLSILTAGCTPEQNQAFSFGLGGFVVNTALTYANFGVWSEDKVPIQVKAVISATVGALGCVNPGVALAEATLLSFLAVRGIVRNSEIRREMKNMENFDDGRE